MTPRTLLACLALPVLGASCVFPPMGHELTSSAPTWREPQHACCLHAGPRELDPWGRGQSTLEPTSPGRAPATVPQQANPLALPAARTLDLEMPARERAPEFQPVESSAGSARLAAELQGTRQALAAAQLELAGEKSRVQDFRAQLARKDEELQDLAARLVQAQIRRVEAEKQLLEQRLATERARLVPQ